jgi:hypothetical protein
MAQVDPEALDARAWLGPLFGASLPQTPHFHGNQSPLAGAEPRLILALPLGRDSPRLAAQPGLCSVTGEQRG